MPNLQVLQSHSPTSNAKSPAKPQESRQICGLDLVRFAAALLVVVHHLAFSAFAVVPAMTPTFRRLGPYTWEGWIGVEIFFVLSGFVIAYSAERAAPRNFAINRFLRLYPTVWICATLTACIIFLDHQSANLPGLFSRWIATLSLFPGLPIIDGVYWTLKVELQFYLLIFILLLLKSFQRIGAVISALGILSSAGWIFIALVHFSTSWLGNHIEVFYRGYPYGDVLLLRFAPFFAIGVLLWLCLLRQFTLGRLASLLICFVGCLMEIHVHSGWIYSQTGARFSTALPLAVWIISLGAIIAAVKGNPSLTTRLGARGTKVCRTLGLMTYPLYLIHAAIGAITLKRLHGRLPDLIAIPFAIFLMIALSFLINRYLESPLRKALGQFIAQWQPVPRLAQPPASSLP